MAQKPAKQHTPHQEIGRTNTLGLTKVDLEAVLDQLDENASHDASRRRQSARISFRHPSLHMDIVQPGGGQTSIVVASRNLSRQGMSFLHSAYLHPGTAVIAAIPHKTLGIVKLVGSIVRCRHVMRHIHDIGVMFKKEINLRDYVDMDTFSSTYSCENVDASKLKGVMLIVAEYKIEAACIQSMLRDTGMEFVVATTVEDGLAKAIKGVDIVVCDYTFETSSGIEFIRKAGSAGVRCPVMLMSADTSPEVRAAIRAAHASAFIPKPIQKDTLLRAVAEFMLLSTSKDSESGQLYSTLPANSPLNDLADEFVKDLRACADEIEKLSQTGDLDGIRKRLFRVIGSAPALGFAPMAKLGNDLLRSLAATMSVEESLMPLNAFLGACRSVRGKGSGAKPSVAESA